MADDWHFCVVPLIPDQYQYKPKNVGKQDTVIEADKMKSGENWAELTGNVTLTRPYAEINADSALYNFPQQHLLAEGNVRIATEQLITIGDKADVKIKKNAGYIENAQFWMNTNHLRGRSKRIEFLSASKSVLTGSTFTSCADDSPAWELSTSTLSIDTEKNEAAATHARLTFHSVPVFYFPYLSFPLSGRKSGLLLPEWGQTTTVGRHLSIPYYINISPNRDATLTARYYQERGNMLDTEYRYLHPNSRGKLTFAYLHQDRDLGEKRYLGNYHVNNSPAEGWQAEVDYNRVSDINYFKDFALNYEDANVTHLSQTATVSYSDRYMRFTTLFQSFQTIDETVDQYSRPYQRYPGIKFNLLEQTNSTGLRYAFDYDYTQFQRDQGLIGRRLDLAPSISYPVLRAAGYVKPKLTMRYTRYQLQHQIGDSEPVRSINQFSVDSGLFMEKMFVRGNETFTQTLEPRLFYLYIPYKDQTRILVEDQDGTGVETSFDSGLPEQSYNQLFRENRFTGLDRIGDSNQLTMALTSRVLSKQGKEKLRFSVGQIFYFKQPELGLPNAAPVDSEGSNVIAEFDMRWSLKWQMQGTFAWQPKDDRSQSGLYRFRYRGDKDTIFGANYRYQRGDLEQADFSVMKRISFHWKGIAHMAYSLSDRENLDKYLGMEYQSCCWSFRIMRRDYVSPSPDVENEKLLNKSIWFQLELKGLTEVSSGGKLDEVFATGNLSE